VVGFAIPPTGRERHSLRRSRRYNTAASQLNPIRERILMSTSPSYSPVYEDLYLFIYQVRPRLAAHDDPVETRFCSVLVAAGDSARAEQIAMNRVHQNGWLILRTDTEARLPVHELTAHAESTAQFEELRRTGTAFWVS
jgi:hypothetical protein